MAATTIGTEFTVVNVVCAVTVNATAPDFLHPLQRASVTVSTADINVSAIQEEFRLYVVIEQPQIPGDRVMAGVAIVFEATVVIVVFQMTGNAIFFSVDVNTGLVTVRAFDIAVLAEQRESRQVMVKKRCLFPDDFVMTVFTAFSLGAFMRTILKMARRTTIAR